MGVSIFLNVGFHFGIFTLNKLIIQEKFKVPTLSLTCLAYTVTFVGLLVCNRVGCLKFVRMPLLKMLPMAVINCTCIVLTNYSFITNSIGSFHLFKASTTLLVILISYLFYGHIYSWKTLIAVVSD